LFESTPAKSLSRELGLFAVFTVSLGAMIGSGIFVLPGLATKVAGPAVIAAYFIAGLVVLPAALSQSEMATAMPQAGGTYLYVDRAMGPLMGTIAGVGTWFAMIFKAAFALVGLGAYLRFFVADIPIRPMALLIAVGLIILNVGGVKQSSRFQAFSVTLVLGVLAFYIADGITLVDADRYRPFLAEGTFGLLEGAGLVFVAYAGVTKVASIAEEVQRPSRNLPLGILISISVMMFLYPAIVLVMVGTTPVADLTASLTPMATSAEAFMQEVGPKIIGVTAVFALVSMANAGLLASSRYPFAMARNRLAPTRLANIGSRSGTPAVSILVTGAALLLLIAFVPLLDLAKLASAFQLLVLSMVNLAVIAFRESKVPWYRPRFRSPFYPWVQLAGITAAGLLLTQMGWVPILGALGIVVGGYGWYRVFGRSRASRESASLDALRIRATARLVAETSVALERPGKGRILIPVRRDLATSRLRDLMTMAGKVVRPGRRIDIIRFQEIPAQVALSSVAAKTDDDLVFERGIHDLAVELGLNVHVDVVLGHDRRRALINYVTERGIDLVLSEMPRENRPGRLFAGDLRWLREHLSCDKAFLRNREGGALQSIVMMGAGGPFDALKVEMADRLATAAGGSVRFVHVVGSDAADRQIEVISEYHDQLIALCRSETTSSVVRSADLVEALGDIARDADLVILGASLRRFRFFADLADRIAERVDCSVLLVEANDTARRSFLGRLLEKFIY
jgi:amino acid transporter/nucleotide-binding universal stress UspA family protein